MINRPELSPHQEEFVAALGPTKSELDSDYLSDEAYTLMPPEEAYDSLCELGYTADTWLEILEKELASHEIRAKIIIALGDKPRGLGIVLINLWALDGYDGATETLEAAEELQTEAFRKKYVEN